MGYPVTAVICNPNPDRHSQIKFVVRYKHNETIKRLDSELIEIDKWEHGWFIHSHSTSLVISPNGKYIATELIEKADKNIVKLWDTKTKESKEFISFPPSELGRISHIAFTKDNKTILSITTSLTSINQTIYFLDINSKNFDEQTISKEIKSLSLSPKDEIVATGDQKGWITIWGLTKGSIEMNREFQAHGTPNEASISSLVFNPKSNILASAGDDCKIKLWNLSKKDKEEILGEHDYPLNVITFSPDGKFLASGDDEGCIKIWDMKTNEPTVLTKHKKAITSLSFTPDSKTLVSGSKDGNIILWKK